MDPNAISLAARTLRNRLATKIGLPEDQVFIGHPATAVPSATGVKQYLNLFLFQVEHSGYPADATSQDPIYVSIRCLITALGNDEGSEANRVSSGENDLRLVGAVVEALHRDPVMPVVSADGAVVSLQIVPASFSIENMNNIWPAQTPDAMWRPSVAYELALAPVPFEVSVQRSPRVGQVGVDATTMDGDVGSAFDWAAEIRFVDGGTLTHTLEFPTTATPADVQVVVAGRVGEKVTLAWEVWHRNVGWQPTFPATLMVISRGTLEATDSQAIPLPAPVDPGEGRQYALVARRLWVDATGRSQTTLSNPLLVSVFKEGSA